MNKTKKTVCPSPAYREYRPDQAMRIAQARAAAVQPPLTSLASSVPSHTKEWK